MENSALADARTIKKFHVIATVKFDSRLQVSNGNRSAVNAKTESLLKPIHRHAVGRNYKYTLDAQFTCVSPRSPAAVN